MLSTPPAFILSQDQTLMLKCSTWVFQVYPLSELTLASKPVMDLKKQRFVPLRCLHRIYCFLRSGAKPSLICSVSVRMKIHWIFRVVSLFNYQGTKFSLKRKFNICFTNILFASQIFTRLLTEAYRLNDSLYSLTHSVLIVKHFFRLFLKSFKCFFNLKLSKLFELF